jgi:hypothetical protein
MLLSQTGGAVIQVNKILSIDLAHTTVRNVGICLLEEEGGQIASAVFLKPLQIGIRDPPNPFSLADAIFKFCSEEHIHLALLDGPQGWKDPGNGLVHSRVCERLLNTPAKTGTFGQVKPANYTQFVQFSISVFAKIIETGAALATNPIIELIPNRLLVLESFPLSAWRKLKMVPLPAKSKATSFDCESRFGLLGKRFGINCKVHPSHDELQALVAGLAGIAILTRNRDGYVAEGVPPFQRDEHWVEGFIVNPL